MVNEINQLLSTIDDHKKLNEKINKHYLKRLKIIEKDLLSMQNDINNEHYFVNFIGYNGIPISNNKHGLMNNLAKGLNTTAYMKLSSGDQT